MRFILVPSFSGKSAWEEVSQYALYCYYAGMPQYDSVVKFVVNSSVGDTFAFGEQRKHLLIRVKHEPEKSGE